MIYVIKRENFSTTNNGVFEGWGTSLCWWAHRVGYSEELCEKASRLFFSKDGLDLNIMRYNIGGGDDPEHDHITRSDSAVPGYLIYDKKTKKTTWDFEADKNQLAVLKAAYKAAGDDAYVEVFSNSPPYFMTVSGCSSGSEDAVSSNIEIKQIPAFAEYLAAVSAYIEKEHNIRIKSVAPMNEPDTAYWKKWSPKQEGCHIAPGRLQSELICQTRKSFDSYGLSHVIVSAGDETSTSKQISSYKKYTPQAKASVGRISTHSYITRRQKALGELRKKEGFNLWMSEVDGSGEIGKISGEMAPALWLSKKIISDINALSPSAWVLWLVMDYHKSEKGYLGKTDNCNYDKKRGHWGLGHCDHDKKEFVLTQKYYAFGQFSRFIRPGMTLIHVSDNILGAYDKKNNKCVFVCVNCNSKTKNITLDLSCFGEVLGTCKTVVTSGSVENGKHWNFENETEVKNKILNASLEKHSVTTLIIDEVIL